nr:Ig-like domain-containing protein [Paludisphaera mucosa]
MGLAIVAGCSGGGGEEDSYSLVPVEGKLTLDGKPLEGASITFNASQGNNPPTDGGDVTGADGTFSAKYRNRSGLAPGTYKITVHQPKAALPGKPAPPDLDPFMMSLAIDAANKKKGPRKTAAIDQPWIYSEIDRTPLSHQVSVGGDVDLVFDLKSTLK